MATHYEALGLSASATIEVIRAAYKALVLVHHPDKTLSLSEEERARHIAVFRSVQEAYDVLSDASQRADYDDSLNFPRDQLQPPNISRPRSGPEGYKSSSPPSIRLTTLAEKIAMRAKTEQDLTALREKRAQRNATRNAEAAKMSLEALTFMMQTWGSLAESDEEMKGYCEKQRDAYQEMIDAKKENARQATPETRRASQPQTPTRAAPSRPRTTPFVTTEEKKKTQSRTPTPSGNSRPPASFTARGRHDMPRPSASNFNPTRAFPRTNTPPPPTESWAQVKERREAAKAAHLEAKAKAVREEKEKLAKKKEVAEKEEKERVTRARAKAHEKKDSVVSDKDTWMDEAEKTATSGKGKSPGGKECQLCGDVHVSLADWKKCAKRRGEDEESGGFFRAA